MLIFRRNSLRSFLKQFGCFVEKLFLCALLFPFVFTICGSLISVLAKKEILLSEMHGVCRADGLDVVFCSTGKFVFTVTVW